MGAFEPEAGYGIAGAVRQVSDGRCMRSRSRSRMAPRGLVRAGVAVIAATALVACDGPQSALDPAGRDARTIVDLFWVMLVGAALLWVAIVGLSIFLVRSRGVGNAAAWGSALIVGGGVALPTVGLAALLSYGIGIMPGLRAPASPDGAVGIAVTGERWWWRVRYLPRDGGAPVVAANEIRVPVGERTEIELDARYVIHAFWVPALAGKIDMFPGRKTRIALEPERAGVFRGQCAEFCGESHALMAFRAVAMERADFDRWLAREALPAAEPATPEAMRGRDLFASAGCGACHTVRGTAADGTFGPDLTHVGSRESLGAGILPNDAAAFERWLGHTQAIKPAVDMPSFGHLGKDDLRALAAYLEGLI